MPDPRLCIERPTARVLEVRRAGQSTRTAAADTLTTSFTATMAAPRHSTLRAAGCGAKRTVASHFLAAPTSTRKRIKDIIKNSTGFIYYVSLTGVTGARRKLPPKVALNVRAIKSMTRKPVAVGFGISAPGQARSIARIADGVIVGSAIVRIIADNQKNNEMLISKVSQFSKTLARAIHGA